MPVPSRPIPDLAKTIQLAVLEQLFDGAHFPSDRKQLVEYARGRFASPDQLAVLDSIPERVYHDVQEVFEAVRRLAG